MIGATAFAFFMFAVAYVAISLIPTLVARRRDHPQKAAIFVLGIVSICVGYFVPFAVYAVLFVIGLIWAYISPAPKIVIVEGLKDAESLSSRGANVVVAGPAGKSAYQIWLDFGNKGSKQDFIDSLKGPKGDGGQDAIPLTDGRGFLKNRVAGE